MKHLDPTVWQVYERLGLAVYIVQSIEKQMAILLASDCELSSKELAASQYDELLAKLFGKTLGELVKRLRQKVELPSDFDERLKAVLRTRNWLVHHYFWDRTNQFTTPEGRAAMIDELDQITDQLNELDEYFDGLLVGRLQHHSVRLYEYIRQR